MADNDPGVQHDPLHELGSELRQAMAGEFRRVAEEDEYAARKAQLRGRTLAQVAYELMARGDDVVIQADPHRLAGHIVHTKHDLAQVETRTGRQWYVNLRSITTLEVTERSQRPGTGPDRMAPESMTALLRFLEMEETSCDILVAGREGSVTGTLVAVAADHVMLAGPDGMAIFLVLPEIVAVATA